MIYKWKNPAQSPEQRPTPGLEYREFKMFKMNLDRNNKIRMRKI